MKIELRTANFHFNGKVVEVTNTSASNKDNILNKDWDEIQQEIFDQLDDSKQFTKVEIEEISNLNTKEFLKNLIDKDETPEKYNRARAIWEYKYELNSAIKNKRPTVIWAAGLDALRLGADAEQYNY